MSKAIHMVSHNFPWRSLKARVVLLSVFLFVLSISLLAFLASRVLREDLQQMLGQQQFSSVSGLAREINDRLSDRQQALETIAGEITPAVLANATALQTLLEQRPLLQLLFNGGVFITGVDGTAIADVPLSAGRVGTNYIDRESVSVPLKEGKTVIGRPAMGKKLGAPIFSITAPILNSQGQVFGVIVGTVNLGKPSFLDQIAQTHYGQTGGYLLISRQHNLIVTSSDKSRIMQPAPAPGINAMHDRYLRGYEGYGVAVNAQGVQQLSAAKTIPVADWFVVATLPTDEAFAPIDAMLRRLMFGALALTLLAGALIWWLMHRLLRRQLAPMLSASRALSQLATHDQLTQALPIERQDEIGELIGGFNRLLETLVQRENALQKSEKQFRALIENLSSGVVVHRPDTSIMLSNAMAASMLGLTEDQLLGKVATDPGWCFLRDDETPMSVDDYPVNRVMASGAPVQNCVIGAHHANRAESTWALCNAYPVHDDDGKMLQIVVTFTDITQLKQAQRALQRSQIMMERTEKMVRLASFEWEVATNIVTWSPEMFRIFGRDPALGVPNLQGQATLYTPQSTQQLYAAVSLAVSEGTPYELELMTVQPDGELRPSFVMGFPERDDSGRVVRLAGLVQDITQRKHEEEKIRLAASVFSHAREGITITTATGIIVDVNEAFTRITGFSRDEAIGQNPRILKSGRQDKAFYAAMWGDLTGLGHWSGEIWNRRKNGEVYAELLTISAVRDAQGITQQYVALFSDITTIKDQQNQLEHIAHFDALTDLPNRVLLADRLQQAMSQAQRRQKQLAVAYLDLDGFKAINDQHSHEAGDHVLVTLAHRMKQALREVDTLSRLGGDEFVAVLIDMEDMAASWPMLNRLLDAAAQPVQWGDLTLQVSASLGVTFYPQSQDIDADQLLRQADQAMYQAKVAGKNRYQIFNAMQDLDLRGHHESLAHVRLALANQEFVLHFQPKVNMRSGQVVGAEALIRWQHPERGLLAPAEFLPVIEDHPLAVDVGEWVIDHTLTQMAQWQANGLNLAQVSVNVGARQLQQGDFVDRLKRILARHPQINPVQLQIEVLETSALSDMAQVSQVIEECAQMGVMFALDDFGTGYSSLTYLKRLRVALLKIDQSFVRDMLEDPDDLAILQGVIGLAAAFKRQVIAEGVETVKHGTALLQLGCELAQGYGIARPMPGADLPAWVAAWQPDAAWSEFKSVEGSAPSHG
ncbi:EAL domain-containing protein [Rhodoferax sp. 4810]|nr:EAL domain-containing protein [Rhodoferax jenense]